MGAGIEAALGGVGGGSTIGGAGGLAAGFWSAWLGNERSAPSDGDRAWAGVGWCWGLAGACWGAGDLGSTAVAFGFDSF
jgi:hypothetical protein